MISQAHLKALETIARKFKDAEIIWKVVGSTSLALQNVDVEARDIDVVIKVDGVDNVQKILSDYCVQPITYSESEMFKSHFGIFNIDGIKTEIMGGLEVKVNGTWNKSSSLDEQPVYVSLNGLQIPTISLQYSLTSYQRMGRLEKAKIIKEFLDEQK